MHERVTQELMGHADSRTTREIYTHTTERMVDAAMAAAEDALDEALDTAIGAPIGSSVEENDGSDGKTADGEGT